MVATLNTRYLGRKSVIQLQIMNLIHGPKLVSEYPGIHVRAEYGADFFLSSFGFKIGQLLRGPDTLQSIPLEQNPELRRFHSWEALSTCAGRTRIQSSSRYHYVGFRYHFHAEHHHQSGSRHQSPV